MERDEERKWRESSRDRDKGREVEAPRRWRERGSDKDKDKDRYGAETKGLQ